MAFDDDLVFPLIPQSYGTSLGPGFSTRILGLDSGAEERNSQWDQPRRRYEVELDLRRLSELQEVRNLYVAARGAAIGFRYLDWLDQSTSGDGEHVSLGGGTPTATDQVFGTGDDSTTAFQLVRDYTFSTITRTRNITKPVDPTVDEDDGCDFFGVALNGVTQTEGVDYTVDYTTGIVTFASPPAMDEELTWGGHYHTAVRFGEGTDDLFGVDVRTHRDGGASVELIELIDELEGREEYVAGGATDHGALSADHTLLRSDGRLQVFDPQSGGLKVFMFEPQDWDPRGGPLFAVENKSLTNSLDLQTYDDFAIITISPQTLVELYLADVGATPTFFAF